MTVVTFRVNYPRYAMKKNTTNHTGLGTWHVKIDQKKLKFSIQLFWEQINFHEEYIFHFFITFMTNPIFEFLWPKNRPQIGGPAVNIFNFSGPLGDRYGRKKILSFFLGGALIFSSTLMNVSNAWVYGGWRTLQVGLATGAFANAQTYGMELVPKNYKHLPRKKKI